MPKNYTDRAQATKAYEPQVVIVLPRERTYPQRSHEPRTMSYNFPLTRATAFDHHHELAITVKPAIGRGKRRLQWALMTLGPSTIKMELRFKFEERSCWRPTSDLH